MDIFSDAKPQTVELFEAHPRATMVIEELGRAYGKARYTGRCPLTGIQISIGDPIRKMVAWTREGKRFEGYVSCRIFDAIPYGATGRSSSPFSTPTGAIEFHFVRHNPQWLDDVEAAPAGACLSVYKAADWSLQMRSWVKQVDGKWRSCSGSVRSAKQLRADLRGRQLGYSLT